VGLRAVKKWWWLETRASEAKGPFPGGKRVGSWGKEKVKKKAKEKGAGRAPADLHPPLNGTKAAKELKLQLSAD
jgi:hypothetical protein